MVGDRLSSGGADLGDDIVGDRRIASVAVERGADVADHDARAAGREQQRMRPPDPAPAAGDDGDPALRRRAGHTALYRV